MITRRQFLKFSAIAGVAFALPLKMGVKSANAFYNSSGIPLWQTTLRGVGPAGIPVSAGTPNVSFTSKYAKSAQGWKATHHSIDITQFTDQIVPAASGLGATTLWGYNPVNPLGGGNQPQKHLGGIIVTQKNVPVQITFTNKLPSTHILPLDPTVPGANQAQNRTATHIHGGLVPWISDGGPHDWWDPAGEHGLSFLNNAVLNPTNGKNQADYYYPNGQSARFLWYHDHAWGITRLNAYAGVATAYLIRDAFEANLVGPDGLPPYIETSVLGGTTVLELPLVFQDKIFVGSDIQTIDPTWPSLIIPGSLWYAHVYEPDRWKKQFGKTPPTPSSSIPEFFGDTMLVNGTAYPQANVEPRRYRLRVLNACGARFLNLQLYVSDGSPEGVTLDSVTGNPTNAQSVPSVLQIGTEAGFLPKVVSVPTNIPFNPVSLSGSLLMAPAERADIIVDFLPYIGKTLVLYNDAPAPFPGGDPLNDYISSFGTGAGPNTRVIMQFVVGTSASNPQDQPLRSSLQAGASLATLPAASNGDAWNDTLIWPLGKTDISRVVPGVTKTLTGGVIRNIRQLTLNETFDAYGRLEQRIGTTVPTAGGTFGRTYMDAPTEVINDGDVEIWQVYNTTADVHPMHFHLFNLQIISRQLFKYVGGKFVTMGPMLPPDPNESGWKETVRMYPGTVTSIIMPIKLPNASLPFKVPSSPRTGGNEYVWHCHILEHEEHDMMRPMIVNGGTVPIIK